MHLDGMASELDGTYVHCRVLEYSGTRILPQGPLILTKQWLRFCIIPPVENVMLGDEDDIKEYADVTQSEFGRVACDAAPIRVQEAVDE